ncbi:MAG: arsenate reductase (azurin) small subunit [Gammaproteobacteria bacterium]
MTTLSRRNFLKFAGGGLAVGAVVPLSTGVQADADNATFSAQVVVAQAKALKTGVPLSFTYPDSASPCWVLKLGEAVPGGVGPITDIVAYTGLCSHMGCPVHYDAEAKTFKCPCHFSIFDPAKGGQQVCGQATVPLPRIVLSYDPRDDAILAIGVEGLIYGRQSNRL